MNPVVLFFIRTKEDGLRRFIIARITFIAPPRLCRHPRRGDHYPMVRLVHPHCGVADGYGVICGGGRLGNLGRLQFLAALPERRSAGAARPSIRDRQSPGELEGLGGRAVNLESTVRVESNFAGVPLPGAVNSTPATFSSEKTSIASSSWTAPTGKPTREHAIGMGRSPARYFSRTRLISESHERLESSGTGS